MRNLFPLSVKDNLNSFQLPSTHLMLSLGLLSPVEPEQINLPMLHFPHMQNVGGKVHTPSAPLPLVCLYFLALFFPPLE